MIFRRVATLLAPTILGACAVNRPVTLNPEPAAIGDFLAARHPVDIVVTDSAGHATMVHNPRLDGDTLRGLRNRELPRQRLAIPLSHVNGIAVPEFSAGRTLGLAGGILAVAGAGIWIIASNMPKPVF